MNPAFQRMFMCNSGIIGRRISYLVDADGYEKLAWGRRHLRGHKSKYGKNTTSSYTSCRRKPIRGIYTDVTKHQV